MNKRVIFVRWKVLVDGVFAQWVYFYETFYEGKCFYLRPFAFLLPSVGSDSVSRHGWRSVRDLPGLLLSLPSSTSDLQTSRRKQSARGRN